MLRLYAILAGAAVVGLVGGLWVATSRTGDALAACRTGTVAGGAGAIGGPFTLIDENGVTVTDRDVITQPSLIYFGYTFCPDVCPLDVDRNAQAVALLDEQGVEVTPIFITVDPARDTAEVVGEFADNFHERMIGLTGTEEQIAAASKAYRTYYRKQDGDDPDWYLVDHSTMSYLVFPETGFVEFFRRDVPAETVAEQLACFVKAAA
jgi:protein SCO1/2